MSRRLGKILLPLLAFLGVEAWLLIFNYWGHNIHPLLLGGGILIASIPLVNRLAWLVLGRLRRPRALTKAATFLLISIASYAVMYFYAITCGRDLFPIMHDEFQFLVQARMLASGHLWMPGHPLPDFFDTFYVLIQPKYAAQSFPGTALLYVPCIWLHLAPWKWSIGIAAVSVGMIYLMTTNLIDGLAGLLAAGMLSVLSLLRYISTMVLAQGPALLLGMTTIWAYMQWRKRRSVAWAAAVGLVGGWMMVTRPADGLVFALPIAIDLFIELTRKKQPALLTAVAMMTLAALPWMGMQLVFNHGVTGEWLTTPFAYYNHRDQPALVYGFHIPQNAPPPMTNVPEKRDYYESGVMWRLKEHTPGQLLHSFVAERGWITLKNAMPQPMLIAFIPVGLLAWFRRRAWIAAAGLPLFFLLYTPYPIFTNHYTIIAAPAVIVGVLLGVEAICTVWPATRRAAWLAAAIFVAGVMMTPIEDYPMVGWMRVHNTVLKMADHDEATLSAAGKPAVLLFTRDPKLSPETEPVYNLSTAWIDDAMVIRAHDRGRENLLIYQYYSTHGPDREFYRFDEARPDAPPEYLGMASHLATQSASHTNSN